jgi:hypothetical protein
VKPASAYFPINGALGSHCHTIQERNTLQDSKDRATGFGPGGYSAWLQPALKRPRGVSQQSRDSGEFQRVAVVTAPSEVRGCIVTSLGRRGTCCTGNVGNGTSPNTLLNCHLSGFCTLCARSSIMILLWPEGDGEIPGPAAKGIGVGQGLSDACGGVARMDSSRQVCPRESRLGKGPLPASPSPPQHIPLPTHIT